MNHQILVSKAARAALIGASTVALIGLAACGQPAFDNSFNTSFDKTTHDSCVPSAVQHGASAADAETYCTCVVTQLNKLTVQQKMALNANSPELQQAATTCNAQTSTPAANAAAAPGADNDAPMGGATPPASAPDNAAE
jgi:hypothetical protein